METGLPGGRHHHAGFNGAIAFQRWKPHGGRGNGALGAIAFQRWKPGAGAALLGDDLASMGPSPFSDGNQGAPHHHIDDQLGLQWGHRLSAMETTGTRTQCQDQGRRFNGAIAFQRWKPVTHAGGQIQTGQLQWGHRLSAMETYSFASSRGGTSASFNGAIAFQRWKPRCPGRPSRRG